MTDLTQKSAVFLTDQLMLTQYDKPFQWKRFGMIPIPDSQIKGVGYIAGPMRGISQHNFPLFFQAEGMLQLWGYKVYNPARMDINDKRAHYNHNSGDVILDNSFKMEDALRRDFETILAHCDFVVVLPGWEQSEGAQKEVAFARSVGLPVFEFLSTQALDIDTQPPLDIEIGVQARERSMEDQVPF